MEKTLSLWVREVIIHHYANELGLVINQDQKWRLRWLRIQFGSTFFSPFFIAMETFLNKISMATINPIFHTVTKNRSSSLQQKKQIELFPFFIKPRHSHITLFTMATLKKHPNKIHEYPEYNRSATFFFYNIISTVINKESN